MGIDLPAFEFLLKANAEFGDFGSTVVLGRQRLLVRNESDKARFSSVLARYRPDLTLDDVLDENVDRLIHALGGKPYQVMDNSDYEGAKVIHDLNEPLPEIYKGAFDTVIDIGTLEHVFNIAVAMKSMAEAVRVGGQFLCLNIANHHLGHGFWQFSPEVFFRTFCPAHGYEPRIADLHYQGVFHPLRDPQAAGTRLPIKTPGYTYITFAARKNEECPVFEKGWPVQADYVAAWTIFQARKAAAEGNIAKAEGLLHEALAKAPNNPAYMVALARLLRQSGRQKTQEYSRLIEQATEQAPDFPGLLEEQKSMEDMPEEGSAEPTLSVEPSQRIEIGQIHLAYEDPRVPENTRRAMERGRYEFKEREIARRMLAPGDRVIEMGAGMGVVSLTIAQIIGSDAIQSFEANPVILDLARENAAANRLPVTFHHAIASPRAVAKTTPYVEFFVLQSFEASSTRRVNPRQEPIKVPTTPLEDEIAKFNANTLVFDIEGFEVEIIEKGNFRDIDKLILEIHPKIIGMDTCVDLIDRLEEQGLILDKDLVFGDVLAFRRGIAPSSLGSAILFRSLSELEKLVLQKEWTKAFDIFQSLEGHLENNAYAQHLFANIAQQSGKPMLRHLEKARQLGSEDFLLYVDLSGQYLNKGMVKKASDAISELERIFPRSAHLATLKARVAQSG